MAYKPRSLIGDANRPAPDGRANALLGRIERVSGKPPLGERDFGAFENRSNRHGELALAFVGVVQAGAV